MNMYIHNYTTQDTIQPVLCKFGLDFVGGAAQMGGKRECQYEGANGERCELHTKRPGQPASYQAGGCPGCGQRMCKTHCVCQDEGNATGRNAPRAGLRVPTAPAVVLQPVAPPLPAASSITSLPPFRVRERSRSRGEECRHYKR